MTFHQNKIIRILVVDDHALIFDGLRGCLAPYPEFEVVGYVEDGLAVYEQCHKLQPDLVLMDLKLPGMDGLDAIRQLRQRWESLCIIMLTATEEEKKAREALDAGANAYVLKNSPQSILLAAIDAVLKNKIYIDPRLNKEQVDALATVADGEIPTLTPREHQVLKLICEGKRNRDIAENLVIGLKTVETHRFNLMKKLNAHNVAELMNWSQRMGF